MKINLTIKRKWRGKVRVLLVFEGEFDTDGLIDRRFGGKFAETGIAVKGDNRVVLGGLGKRTEFELERVRVALAKVLRRAGELGADEVGLPITAGLKVDSKSFVSAAVEGAILSGYQFRKFRTVNEDVVKVDRMAILAESEREVTELRPVADDAERRARAVCYVRDLVNEPSASKAPMMLADRAKELAQGERVTIKVMDAAELERLGMGGIIGVGKGSHNPPCMVHLTYKPKVKPKRTMVVVGKGITFDSGGLSLKTAQQMESMKDDMAGAATVFGLFNYLREVDIPVVVHGLTPLAENLPGGGAQKPGDVIRHFNGKTVEVMNTDAEGRLILADALAYGATLKPDLMIDIATLTGACVVALGNEISGVLGTDEKTIARLIAIGKEMGEYFWQLPLFERYRSHMKSGVADFKNIGKPQNAGTIIGGLFLSEFVPKTVPWVHIDIAGTAYTNEDRDYCPAGATGVPLRTLIALFAGTIDDTGS
ncbi:leucyl aminopeptidase [candidate division WOR-3 bacterium]|nr:leucyl aminopeptidase [candidate division WOR-3 bacterium]